MWDTDGLHADQRARLEQSPKTAAGTPDFSLLVDGLAAEREQGTTIDIAWRYLDTGALRLVIIDSPGHEQYTRNMATGASHADVAILLVDARGGVKEQTRRHAAILDLMGVRRVVLAVNKMDLVGWSEARFAEIRVTGSFMLVDAISGASMAGGVVTAVQGREATTTQGAFRLMRDLLARGLGADLPQSDRHADQELCRRANEVAILLRQAGGGVGGCVGPGRHRCGRRLAGADGDPVVRLGRRGALGLVGAGRTEARRA